MNWWCLEVVYVGFGNVVIYGDVVWLWVDVGDYVDVEVDVDYIWMWLYGC